MDDVAGWKQETTSDILDRGYYYMLRFITPCLILVLGLSACKDNGNPIDGKPPCGGIDPGVVPQPPYDSPIWHPSGQFIGFNHTPLKRITYPYGEQCWGVQHFAGDSAGFWMVNPDGTNMQRIFPYKLLSPAWSPDGQWIAFSLPIGSDVHIFKMRFAGATFDTTTLVQLTTEGRNFFPAWSPDGQWISYNKSICEGPNTCGIWLMTSSGTNHRFLADYGNFPSWHPSGTRILYWTVAVTQGGQTIGDSLWTYNINANAKTILTFVGGQNRDSRHAKYSPGGTKIAFWSNSNLWIMDSTGSNLRQLSIHGVDVSFGLPFSWSPDGTSIVYTVYRSDDWGYANGVFWVVDVTTGIKRQLTFNLQPIN